MGNGGSSNGPAYQTREYKDLSRSGKKIYDNETTDDFDKNILLTLNAAGCNTYFNLNDKEKTAFKSLDRDNRIHFLKMSDSLRAIFFDMETDGEKAFLLRNYSIDVDEFDRRLERYRSSVQFKENSAAIEETRNRIRRDGEESKAAWDDLRKRINGTEDNVNELRNDVDTLQTDMTNVRNDVNTLQTDMTNVQNNVNDVQTRTTNLEHNANTQNNRLNRVTEEINNIKKEQEEDRRAREEERRENEDIVNFLQERFHYGMKKVNELSSSTSSTSSEIPLQEIETEHSEIL